MERKIKNGMRVMKKILKTICVSAALMSMMMLSGCGSKGASGEDDIAKQAKEFNDSIVKEAGSDTSGNKDIVVGSVNMGMNGEWFSEVMNGIKNAGNDLGVTLKMLDSESDTDIEAQNIDKLLDEGIDVLIISPIDYEVSAKSLQKVKDAGIPIITWNTTVDMPVTAEVGVDSTALGGDTGDYVTEYIKTNNLDSVNIILLTNTSYEIGIARCDGFKASIQDLVDEGTVNIVAEQEAEAREDAESITQDLLKKNSDATMIWAWNQSALLGAVDAVKSSGNSDIIVMGTDMSMELANDMLGNEVNLQAVTTQLPYNMGYKAVVNGVKAAKGEEVENKVTIPLDTIVKSDVSAVKQYIENHKDLVSE